MSAANVVAQTDGGKRKHLYIAQQVVGNARFTTFFQPPGLQLAYVRPPMRTVITIFDPTGSCPVPAVQTPAGVAVIAVRRVAGDFFRFSPRPTTNILTDSVERARGRRTENRAFH